MTARRLFVSLFALALFTMAVRETLDPDMWWHLRAGETILRQGIPRQDIFSFTVPDQAWVTHEWLSQAFMWLVYQAGGLEALVVVFALLIALSFWLVFLASPGKPYLAAFVVLLAAISSAIVWGARPQIFNLLFMAVFIYLLESCRDGRLNPRALWLLPALTALWANLHSGYLLGVVFLATATLGETLQRWLAADHPRALTWLMIRRLALITVSGFVAAGVNPNGTELWFYPFFTLGSQAMQAYIQEWHSPDFHQPYFWPFAILIGIGVLAWVWSSRRPTLSDLLLFLGTAAAGLISARHIPLFALVAVPVTTRHLESALSSSGWFASPGQVEQPSQPAPRLVLLNWVILLVMMAAAAGWTAAKLMGNEAKIAAHYPVTAVDFLEESGLDRERGYNSYNWGGYLIWRGLPVYVDGRADVYGDDFLFFYRRAYEARPDWSEPLDSYQVQFVLMERGSLLSALLVESEQWQLAYSDDVAQIFVRSQSRQQPHETRSDDGLVHASQT